MNVSFIMKLINPGTLADHYKLVWEVCGIEHGEVLGEADLVRLEVSAHPEVAHYPLRHQM